MRANKLLRVGIVGCGDVAQWAHIPSLCRTRNAELVAVCDKNEDLARGVAKKNNIGKYYADFLEMLAEEKLDMVNICTPPRTHATFSIEAMRSGCHVLVEKPMAMSVKEADEMIRAGRDYGVKLGVVHNMLFVPVAVKARSMVSEGAIGDLTAVDIRYSLYKYEDEIVNRHHWCHELPAGIFSHKLPHPIYLAMAFLGHLEPVAAYTKKLGSYDWMAADELRVILEGEKGLGMITLSCNWPKDTAMLDIFGTKRNLHIYFNNAVVSTYGLIRYGRLSRGLENVRQSLQLVAGTACTALNIFLRRHHYGHYALIRGFIESVQNGTEAPVTAEEGREVVRVCEKIISQIGSGLQRA